MPTSKPYKAKCLATRASLPAGKAKSLARKRDEAVSLDWTEDPRSVSSCPSSSPGLLPRICTEP